MAENTKLDAFAKIVTMLASIAVPVTIGIVGWGVQRTVSEQGLRKDYTDIALRVLTQAESNNHAELRQWAVDVLDKNAPLPFSADVRRQLLGNGILFRSQMRLDMPSELMEPPDQWIEPPKEGFSSNEAANKNYSENYKRAKINILKMEALQHNIAAYRQAQEKLEVSLQQIESNSAKEIAEIEGK